MHKCLLLFGVWGVLYAEIFNLSVSLIVNPRVALVWLCLPPPLTYSKADPLPVGALGAVWQ